MGGITKGLRGEGGVILKGRHYHYLGREGGKRSVLKQQQVSAQANRAQYIAKKQLCTYMKQDKVRKIES